MEYYPNQRVSFKEKQKASWYKPTTDYLINKAISERDLSKVKDALDAANGIVSKDAFDYVLKPFNSAKDGEAPLPSPVDIRGVDFITPLIEKLMGEYLELPYKFMVTVNSDDTVVLRDAACAEAVYNIVEDAVIKQLESMQQMVQSGQQDPQELQNFDLDAFAKKFKEDWIDERAKKSQFILDHVYKYNDFDFQRIQLYYYWLTTNEMYTHRYIENGELIREVLSPLECFPISNGEQFVEDYDGFVIKRKITFTQLIEDYLRSDLLSLADLEYLEGLRQRYSSRKPVSSPVKFLKNRYDFAEESYAGYNDDQELEFVDSSNEIFYYTCVYRSETKVKILKYLNSLNQVVEMPVPYDYELNHEAGDLELETTYITEILVSHRFGDENTGIYTKPQKDLIQRYDSVTRSPKLPINGKRGLLEGIAIKPIGIRLLPFEVVDRILLHQIETTIAKFKGSILLMPQSLVKTDDTGTTRQKYFYMRADGTLIYDDSEVDFNTIAQGVRFVTDEVLGRYLETLINLRNANRRDAYEIVSMNEDRNAQIDTRANVSNVQQNIYRAKLGSALLVYVFNKVLERDHIADLEYSKYAYVNGIADTFYDKGENKVQPYSFDTIDLLESKLGVYVSNSKLDEAKLQFLADSLSHAASQSGDFEIAIEAATSDSIPLLKQRIKELSAAKREFEQQMSQMAEVAEDKKHQFKMKEIEAVNTKDITIALIKADFDNAMTMQDAISKLNMAATPNPDNPQDDVASRVKEELDRLKIQLEQRKQTHKEQQDKIENRLKEKKIEADKYIAKINKN